MTIMMVKSYQRGKTYVGWAVLLLILTTLLAVGCRTQTIEPQTEMREPFSAQLESEDGAIVAWSGDTKGYERGAAAAFDVAIKNETKGSWHGRYCLQLLARESHTVITTLEQREFTLEPDMGFSEAITVHLPEGLDAGAYGLSLAVHRPGGPMVDLVSVWIGETDEVRRATTQQDIDASLEACPPVMEAHEGSESLVAQAKADLVQELDIGSDEIQVQRVEETEFPDASLGVPEPGKTYAQVVTPGYVIRLVVEDRVYVYHGSGERVVRVPQEGNQPGAPVPAEPTYRRVDIADSGLSVEVPDDWVRLEPEWVWTPAGDSGLLLGVRCTELQPPQEAGPTLLPKQAQIVDSREIALGWGSGRLFTVEVYTPAVQGKGQAVVRSTEMHAIVVVNQDGTRHAFDLYLTAPDKEQMATHEALLLHLLDTSMRGDAVATAIQGVRTARVLL